MKNIKFNKFRTPSELICASAIICALLLSGCGGTQETAGSCVLSIDCLALAANEKALEGLSADQKALLPADGFFVQKESVEFFEGENALTLLQRYAKSKKLPLDVSGGTYVTGIGNLYAGDAGEMSAWLFFLNGECASVGANEVILQQGDLIEFRYTCDFGADLGVEW